jgi:hypothetical protein
MSVDPPPVMDHPLRLCWPPAYSGPPYMSMLTFCFMQTTLHVYADHLHTYCGPPYTSMFTACLFWINLHVYVDTPCILWTILHVFVDPLPIVDNPPCLC